MLNNLKVGTKLALGFAITLILLIVIAVLSVMRFQALSDEIELVVNDRLPKLTAANDINTEAVLALKSLISSSSISSDSLKV